MYTKGDIFLQLFKGINEEIFTYFGCVIEELFLQLNNPSMIQNLRSLLIRKLCNIIFLIKPDVGVNSEINFIIFFITIILSK